MAQPLNPKYREYHPKWYRRRMPIFWWLRKLPYTKFIIRELTSIAVAYSALLLLVQTWALSRGDEAYQQFVTWLGLPVPKLLNIVVLLVLLYHTVTWLSLAPKALVVRVSGRRIPDGMVIAGHYMAWGLASAFVLWFLVLR